MSLTIEPLGWWYSNWRTNIPKTLLHCCESSTSHNRLPNLGILQRGVRIPRKFDFEGQQDLTSEFPQNWGSRNSWRAQILLCVYKDPGKRISDLARDWSRLAYSVWESPVEACVHAWHVGSLPWGQRTLISAVWGDTVRWHKSFWRRSTLPLP